VLSIRAVILYFTRVILSIRIVILYFTGVVLSQDFNFIFP
jgi:hypothetical protein